jgi:hypothetical protein
VNQTKEELLSAVAAINAFRDATESAKKLLPPIETLNGSQRRLLLCEAVKHLESADLPYFSRAINLLMGQRDRVVKVRGGWFFKQRKNGKIRHRAPDIYKKIEVSAT